MKKQEFKKPLTHEQFVKLAKDKGYKSKEEASKDLGYRWDSENWIDDRIKPYSKRPKYEAGGGIEVVGKGNKGAFRKREYEGMAEEEVKKWWEDRGYKLSKSNSESKLKPYEFYINKYAKGSTVKGGVVTYTIWRMDDNGQRKVYQKIPTEKEAKEIKAKEQLKYPKEVFRIQKFKGEFSAEPLDLVENKYEIGGEITLTSEQVEKKLGRKLHWWNDDVVTINGIEYKKVFLKDEYKRL